MALTTRSKALTSSLSSLGQRSTPNSRRQRLGRLLRGPVPDRDLGARACAAPRSPPAPSRRRPGPARACRRPARRSRAMIPVASVFSAAIPPSREAQRVRGADRPRRRREAVSATRERRELVRDGHVDAGEAALGQRARPGRRSRSGLDLDRLVGPLVAEAELGQRRGLHRRRARVGDRVSEHGEPRHQRDARPLSTRSASRPLLQAPAWYSASALVELLLGLGEDVLAAGARA